MVTHPSRQYHARMIGMPPRNLRINPRDFRCSSISMTAAWLPHLEVAGFLSGSAMVGYACHSWQHSPNKMVTHYEQQSPIGLVYCLLAKHVSVRMLFTLVIESDWQWLFHIHIQQHNSSVVRYWRGHIDKYFISLLSAAKRRPAYSSNLVLRKLSPRACTSGAAQHWNPTAWSTYVNIPCWYINSFGGNYSWTNPHLEV